MKFGITFIKGDIDVRLGEDSSILYSDEQYHTYEDWGLIPASRPIVNLPEVKTTYVECEAMDGGGIDVSEALTGYPLYKNRPFSQTFYRQGKDNWPFAFSEIFNWLHGQKVKMVLDDDPGYYYVGRFTVKDEKSDKYWSSITISGDLDPFKYYVYSSDEYPRRVLGENGKVSVTEPKDLISDLIDHEAGYAHFSNALFYDGTPSLLYSITAGPRPVTPKVYIDISDDTIKNFGVSYLKVHLGPRYVKTAPEVKVYDFNKWVTLYGIRIPPYKKNGVILTFMRSGEKKDTEIRGLTASVIFSYRKGML